MISESESESDSLLPKMLTISISHNNDVLLAGLQVLPAFPTDETVSVCVPDASICVSTLFMSHPGLQKSFLTAVWNCWYFIA